LAGKCFSYSFGLVFPHTELKLEKLDFTLVRNPSSVNLLEHNLLLKVLNIAMDLAESSVNRLVFIEV
jgi:hypothetical protein